MKKDIENRTAIENLINTFYDKIKEDGVLGPVFNVLTSINWNAFTCYVPVLGKCNFLFR
jgi:truncated hemoglobin YjbI